MNANLEKLMSLLDRVRHEVGKVIIGQSAVVDQALIVIFTGQHALIEGIPGIAKTLLARTLAHTLGCEFARIQFTPDLMPADITGTNVFNLQRSEFSLVQGPVFTSFLLADEINRAPAKTQSALLQAMQERKVSIAGHYHDLPSPFHVVATQNPLEQEGTYPLPEAQLDRFLLQIDVGYPDLDAERRMLLATTGTADEAPQPVLTAAELLAAQHLVRRIPVGETVVEAILRLVREGRHETTGLDEVRRHVSWGPGPRAAQALMLASRARCLLEGRLSPSLDDVAALAPPILRHRMALTFSARADGVTVDEVIAKLVRVVG